MTPKRIVVIDCQTAGIAGDMVIGALIDLGANATKIVGAMKSVKSYLKGCGALHIVVKDVDRRGIRAKRVEIVVKEKFNYRTGTELRRAVADCGRNLKLSEEAKAFALNCIDILLRAESRVHGKSAGRLHLHEIGSADTVIEIIGTTVALEELELFKNTEIYSTPVAVGGGLIKFSHGAMTSPAPATVEILKLKNLPMIGGPVEAELTTPTGAALLASMVKSAVPFHPLMKPKSTGYGAGSRDFRGFPNVLRVTLGEEVLTDEVYVLETNLDDVSGEVVGHTMDKLLGEGARDVSVIPMLTKKSRPGYIVKVIADRETVEHLSQVLMEETGTLGIRIHPCLRRILTREVVPIKVEVEGVKERITVKVAKDHAGKIVHVKPEYEEIKRLAEKTGKPLRVLMELTTAKAKQMLGR